MSHPSKKTYCNVILYSYYAHFQAFSQISGVYTSVTCLRISSLWLTERVV